MTDTTARSLLAAYQDAIDDALITAALAAREHAEQVKRDRLSLTSTLGELLSGYGLNHEGLWCAAESYLDDTIIWSLIEEHGSAKPHIELLWSADLMREPLPVVAERKTGDGQVVDRIVDPHRGPIVVVEPPELHHCDHPQSSQARMGDLFDGLTSPQERIARLARYARQCPCGHWRKPR